jgi:RNA polymerase-interacting CarD/CdnL/TRCF family regulator
MFWGTPAQSGTLCNLREVIRRTQVDKAVKVFNTADEFLMHTIS